MSAKKQKTILLVEDEVLIAMAEKMTLEKFGYQVLVVHNGEDAVTTVAKTPDIDLILMDINLGAGMDGTEAAALILKDRDLPVVFLSSHTEPEVVAKTEKITSYGYVVKNSSGTVLDASIKMAFKLFAAKEREKEKEAALAHSRELMQYVIEHMRSAVAVHDRDLRYIFVSQRYLDEYKLKEQDIIGKHHYEVFPDLPQKWRDVHQRALAGEISRAEDDPYEREDGTVEWTRWECRPWYEADGSIGGIIVYTEVTSERKLAEKALRASEAQFRTLTTLAPIGIYLTDVRGQCRYANPRWCEMTGLTLKEALGDGWTRGLHPEDRKSVIAAWQKTVESEDHWELEYRFRTPDGKVTWVHGLAAPQRDATGRISGYVGANVDISERKLAEEALIVSEARSRALLRTIPDLLFRVNRECVFLDYQAETKNLYAQGEPTLIGKRCRDVLPPEFVELIEAKIRAALESGALQTFEYQLPVPGLGVRSYEARMAASGADEVTAIIRDITESHRAQQALRESEERWRDILFSMADWVWEVDANGVYTYSSEQGARFLGFSRQEIIGKTPFDFMPPNEATRVGPIFGEIVSRKGIIKDLENWNIDKHGKRICLLTNGMPILDEQGNLRGYRGVDKDITERKQAENRLKSALSFQQALLDAVPSPIFYKDANLAYIGCNKAFERYIGLEREQFIGKTVFDIAPAGLAENYDKADRELLKNAGVQTYEASVGYADGTLHDVIFNKAVFTDSEGKTAGMIGVILDISEHKRAQAALKDNNSRLELAMQAADMAWWEMDLASGSVIFEKRKADMLGFPPEQFKHYLDFMALVHPDDHDRAMNAMREHIEGALPRYDVEYRIATRSGAYKWFHDIGSVVSRDADGKPLKATGLAINVTERKQVEEALRESETRFHSLFDNMGEGVALHELVYEGGQPVNYRIIDVNDRFLKIIGVARKQVIGKLASDAYATTTPPYLNEYAGVASSKKTIYFETYFETMGKHFAISVAPWRDSGFATIFSDISDRKRVEKALRESEAKQSNALQMTHAGHWEYDVDRDLFTFNDNFYRIFRTTAAAVGGYQMSSAEYARRFCHPDDAAQVGEETRGAIASPDPNYSRQIEHRILYADGEVGLHRRALLRCQGCPGPHH